MRRPAPLAALGVLAALLGALAGVLGSFDQAVGAVVPLLRLHVGLVLALLLTLAVFTGAALVTRHRSTPVLALLGWLAAVLVLSMKRPEGDLVVPATPSGYAWLLGGSLLGAVAVVLAPRLARAADAGPGHPGASTTSRRSPSASAERLPRR